MTNQTKRSGLSWATALLLTPLLTLAMLVGTVAVGPAPSAEAAVTTDENLFSGDGVSNRAVATSTDIDSQVWAMESVGTVLFTGGKFRTVRDRSAGLDVPQGFLAAFDANTGEFIPWFRPYVNGPVYDIKDVGNGQILVAGEFTSINGVPRTAGLARLNLADGSVDTSFVSSVSGGATPVVRSLEVTDTVVYAGGSFNRHVGPDSTARRTGAVIKVDRATGQLDSAFAPSFDGGVWGVAHNSTYNRLFAVGLYSTVNGTASPGFAALDDATGANSAGYSAQLPTKYLNVVNRLGPQLHDVETTGDRVIITSKHHLVMLLTASSGSYITHLNSNGTQSVDLSRDEQYAYVGCHCFTTGYQRVIELSTGNLVAENLKNVTGTAGVWASEELANGCVWTGGALDKDRTSGAALFNTVRLCPEPDTPPVTGPGLPAPSVSDAPPSVPGTPELSQSGATVSLTWQASTGAGQFGYIVYRDGAEVGRSGTNSFDDLLVPVGVHQWTVVAADLTGNLSDASAPSQALEIGQPVNIAPDYAFQASPGRNGTTPAAIVDGDLNSYWYPEAATMQDFYFQLDFGQLIPIDYVLIHESSVQKARLGLAAASVKLSTGTFPNTRPEESAKDQAFSKLRVDRFYRELVRLDVSTNVRSIRLDSYSNFGQAIDELEIYTTQPLPTPAAPAADRARPTAPTWSRVRTLADQTILEWGGDSDDRGVVRYEVRRDGVVVGTSSTNSFAVVAGERASSYDIVAIDAAGNRSLIDVSVVSTGQPAEQSSTGWGGVPERATDGNTDGVHNNNSVTHTTSQTSPWWQVDLGSKQALESVTLWNRTDCCTTRLANVHVFTSDDPFPDGATVASLSSTPGVRHDDLGAAALGRKTTVGMNGEGRYVRVMLEGQGILSLAEVEVRAGTSSTAAPPDTERPDRPTALVVSSVDGAAELSWTAATDNVGVTGYQVYRTQGGAAELVGTSETTTYTDDTVVEGETYSYYLRAYDAAENLSWRTGAVSVEIAAEGATPPDTERPDRPTGLVVSSVDGAAELSWTAATDNVGVTGYQVYRTQGGAAELVGTSETTTYTDDTVVEGETYSYYLRAYDAAENLSWRTGAVSVAIPVPVTGTSVCTFTRDGTNVTVEWDFAAPSENVVIERSVDGGRFWQRGITAYEDATWTDTDRANTLEYRTVPKDGNVKGAPVDCTTG